MSVLWTLAALGCFASSWFGFSDPFEAAVLGMLCVVMAKLNMKEAE